MLCNLHIENIAVIEKTDIEFDNNFNVLTGETGAGKSIIIDSVNLILGARASKELVRTGAGRAHVSAVFSDISKDVSDVLKNDYAIENEDGMLVISRDIIIEDENKMKNICRVNSRIVTVSLLRDIGKYLINIHGQNDNQFLLQEERHIDFLDSYAMTKPLLLEYRVLYNQLSTVNKKIKLLETDESEKQRKEEMLEYQINEIEQADLSENEDSELEKQLKIMQNMQMISDAVNIAYENIYGTEEAGAYDLISESSEKLSSIAEFSESLTLLSEKCTNVLYSVEDLSETLRDLKDEFEYSSGEINEIQERLDLIYKLKKKYGGSIYEISEYYKKIVVEYNSIKSSDEQLDKLREQKSELLKKIFQKAEQLTDLRKKNAENLEKAIIKELKFLEMNKVRFRVEIKTRENDFGPLGLDDVCFLISTNPGEDLKPLAKIASGGELSRVMLALKKVLSSADDAKTLIFDEIDTGVSGRAAGKIGLALKQVSKNAQVLCITHLAQIASLADSHLLIKKEFTNKHTFTSVEALSDEMRINEIARMLGGVTLTQSTKETAREMIEQGRNI